MRRTLPFSIIAFGGLCSAPSMAFQDISTALRTEQINKILYQHCAVAGNNARRAAEASGSSWDALFNTAKSQLARNIPASDVRRMIDEAEYRSARSSPNKRDIDEFTVCILDNKLAYAEGNAR